MANLPETEDFADGTYQIETSDRVLGGPGGIANKQAEQLGNRTAWLKAAIAKIINGTAAVGKATQLAAARTLKFKGAVSGSGSYDGTGDTEIALTLVDTGVSAGAYTRVTVNAKGLVTGASNPATLSGYGITDAFTKPETTSAIQQAIAKLVDSSPAALDTLRELGDALGNDPNFATTMANALAGKAAKATTIAGYGITDAFTKPETTSAIQQAIASLVNSSPAALDTLKELADALGNDPNFATTMTNALASKANKASTLTGYGITDTYTKDQITAMIAQASALPVGSMIGFPVDKVAPGFLELDGSVKSAAAYPDLATFLSGVFNKGDEGAGNFRLPESRAEFLRGWDHGRGVDAGRVVGSGQMSQNLRHVHAEVVTNSSVADLAQFVAGSKLAAPTLTQILYNDTNATDNFTVIPADHAASGGAEARPRNIAVMWCIKAWNAPINQGNIDIAALAPLAAQTTEINQGTAKISTQAQVDAGTDDATIITPKKLKFGLTIIKGASSWAVEFPSWLGLLKLQWGVHSGQTGDAETSVTFPIGFDAVPTCVSMLTHEGDTTVQSSTVTQGRKMTTTGFLSRRDDIGSVSTFSGAVSIRWFAIGF
jgi:phage-related tail fiber protein